MSEEWKDVVGYENKYQVSNLGRVKSLYLINRQATIPITNFGSVDLEDLMDSIKQFKKVPTSLLFTAD